MKTINWIQLISLIGLFSVGIGYSVFEKRQLESCSIELTALVIDKYLQKKRGYFVEYEYEINGVKYSTTKPLSEKSVLDRISLGSIIDIKVSCDNPNLSEIKKI